MEIHTNIEPRILNILLKIIDFKNINSIMQIEEELLKQSYSEEDIRNVIKLLEDEEIFEIQEDNIFFYYKRLRNLIDEQNLTNKWYKYFYNWHFCHW